MYIIHTCICMPTCTRIPRGYVYRPLASQTLYFLQITITATNITPRPRTHIIHRQPASTTFPRAHIYVLISWHMKRAHQPQRLLQHLHHRMQARRCRPWLRQQVRKVRTSGLETGFKYHAKNGLCSSSSDSRRSSWSRRTRSSSPGWASPSRPS